jgi:signal transduction histidine kinase
MDLNRIDLTNNYNDLVTEIISKTYSSGYSQLNEVIRGPLFKKVLSEHLGFEVANFYFYDNDEGRLMWFHEAVSDGIVMPFYMIHGQNEDGTFQSSPVPDRMFEERRTQQYRALKEHGEPLTASLCYRNLTIDHRWSRTEAEYDWILIPEGEIAIFSYEYMLRKMLHKRGVSSKTEAIGLIESSSITEQCWASMHDANSYPQMAGRESDSLTKARGWLREVVLNKDKYEYLWTAKDEKKNWFIEAHDELLRCLDAAPEDQGDHSLITELGKLVIRYSHPFQESAPIGIFDAHFYDRSRISPRLELLHGSHNIVVFLVQFYFPVDVVPVDEPLKAFLLGTFFDRERCVENRAKIRNIYSLAATRDFFRYSMTKLAGILKTIRKTEEIMATFGGSIFVHELKNPLSLIKTSAEVMLEDSRNKKDLADLESNLEMIRSTAKEALGLLDGMRSIAQLALITKKVRIALSLGVPRIIGSLKENREISLPAGMSIDMQCDDRATTVYINEMSLKIVLKNLIINAIDATEEMKTGRIITVRCWKDDDWIRLEIADNGPGISETVLRTLFAPFVSTKRADGKGVGLGLYLCQNIIELQGGMITARNSAKGGAIFTINFKAA